MDELLELLALLARLTELDDTERARVDELLPIVFAAEGEGDTLTHPILAQADDDQLAALDDGLVALFDAERGADSPNLDTLRAIADEGGYADVVRGEDRRREEEAQAAQAEVDRLAGRIQASDTADGEGDGTPGTTERPADAGDGGDDAGDGGDGGDAGDGAGDGEGGEGDGESADAEGREPVGVTAGATPRPTGRVPLGRIRRGQPAERRHDAGQLGNQPRARIIGPNGRELANLGEAGEALSAALEYQLGVQGGYSERVPVVRIEAVYPEERRLSRTDAELNAQRIDAVVSPEALVAAGGLCAPLEPYYGVAQVATAARPVKAGLAGFQADRGGIVWVPAPRMTQVEGGVSIWTADNDADPGSDGPATKPVVVVDCEEEQTARVRGIVSRIQFGNLTAMTYPERTRALTELLAAVAARTAETALLDDLKDGSTQVSAGQALGATRDLLYAIGVAAAGYRSRLRMDPNARLRTMLPSWVMDMIREDIARSLASDTGNLAVADEAIRGFFNARRVNVTEYIDSSTDGNQIFPPQGAGQSLLDFPDAVEFPLFHEGAWLGLDLGRIDLGIVRDSTLNDTNDYQLFAEVFEGTAHVGLDSYWVTAEVCPNGASAGTVDPSDLCAGQYVPSV